MNPAALGIFLKAPRPGSVKTRLCPPLSPAEAADLYTGLLADTLELALNAPAAHRILFYDGPRPESFLPPRLMEALGQDWSAWPQQGDDLGQRLSSACQQAQIHNQLPLLLLGSDSPDLPAEHLRQALAALEQCDLVLGPASDGGVWCIGVGRVEAGLFDQIPWSSAETGAALGNRAADLGFKVQHVDAWHDVDEFDDLRSLGQRLARGGHAPHTARVLRRWNQNRHREGRDPLIEFEE